MASGNIWDVNCSTNPDGTYPQITVTGPLQDNAFCPSLPSNVIIENNTPVNF